MDTTTYRIEVPGLRTRTAKSLRGAERAMGQMMCHVEKGTRGTISQNGRVVVVAECTSLGWFKVSGIAPGHTVAVVRHGREERATVLRVVGMVAVIKLHESGLTVDWIAANCRIPAAFEAVA